MSFFNDFFEYFNVSENGEEPKITLVFGLGLMISGNIKLGQIDEDKIVIYGKHRPIYVCGTKLVIKTIAKGEVVVSGDINLVEAGECYGK